jgi:hypothetical protein
MSLYEIHISVLLPTALDEIRWFYFCKDNKYKVIRVLNDKGTNSIQNMISKWCNRKSHEEAIEYAKNIGKKIEDHNFKAYRVKVEAMLLNRQFDKTLLTNTKGVYWEFHFKIIIENSDEFESLLNWKNTRKGQIWKDIALSYSSYGKTHYPIVTIRLYTGTRLDAIDIKDYVIDDLKAEGFHIADKMQSECSIYDSFPEEDKGWIN